MSDEQSNEAENGQETPDNEQEAPTAPVHTIKCEILRDTWDKDGKRHPKGTLVDIPVEAAMDGVEQGHWKRAREAPVENS